MKAFVTGSRAYGSPHISSDTDLVVMVSPEDLEILTKAPGSGYGGSEGPLIASLRFGRLNLICVTNPTDYEIWAEGTRRLLERAPVTRQQAVNMFTGLRQKVENPPRWRAGDVPTEVSLLKLVSIGGTSDLWPAELRGFVEKILEDRGEKAHWGACADWLDDRDEPELAAAFRVPFRRPDVQLMGEPSGKDFRGFYFSNLPPTLNLYWNTLGIDTRTVPGACAALARAITAAKKDLE